jgi:endoglucanase
MKSAVLLAACLLHCGLLAAQPGPDLIRLDQAGFYPQGPKTAVLRSGTASRFALCAAESRDTVFRGVPGAPRRGEWSGEALQLADFSAFRQPGRYVLCAPGLGCSYPFDIQADVHMPIATAALKGFYYQRASAALPPAYAGAWSRAAGHPDREVLVHPSAVSPGRPAGTVIASPGGWYDAGDYNKYIVNSGITMGTLLSLLEDFPETAAALRPGIPEAGNALPDLLDEILWNLRWMLTMQDPGDGGVYHKLTNPEFGPLAQAPADAQELRYVVQKSTAAALDFAAVMAQASRVCRPWLPALADSCLAAARSAWHWAGAHPEVLYRQEAMNAAFDPDVHTGAYGDGQLQDEWIWAAAELYVTTGEAAFYRVPPDAAMPLPAWNQVRLLGYYTLLRHAARLGPEGRRDLPRLRRQLLAAADSMAASGAARSYGVVMGGDARDFVWGSNAVAANQGILLVQAWKLRGKRRYAAAALGNLEYLLGRNASGYCFVTGAGSRRVMHPHHRLSEGDAVREPVPGLLAGGPNPGRQDGCAGYPSGLPDACYLDDACSYASNEIAINWNAPLVYLAAAMEAAWAARR